MNLVELAEVPDSALPLARLKEHLRLGTGFPDDDVQDVLLGGFLRAAIDAIEGRTGKALLRRPFALTLAAWRHPDRQPLPAAPVATLTRIALLDGAGTETPLPLAAFRLKPDAFHPAVIPMGGFLPPIPRGGAARIEFEAGFGPTWADVPKDLAQAVLMLAAHYHDHRADTGLDGGCMPFGVSALIERHRPIRLGGAA
jgi:uncharacterized phiE125 gp8 family phage protein